MVNTDLDFRVTKIIITATVLKPLNLDFDRLYFKAMRFGDVFTVLRQCQKEMFSKRSVCNFEGHCNA